MIIMNKFEKRISKFLKDSNNCLIIGSGFGHLEELLGLFKTVFVIDTQRPAIKAKNLVYRESIDNLASLTEFSIVFFDLNRVQLLDSMFDFLNSKRPVVCIEDNDPIGRDLSGTLYKVGYQCTNLQGFFHVWEYKK